jgi:hypothetical protein
MPTLLVNLEESKSAHILGPKRKPWPTAMGYY